LLRSEGRTCIAWSRINLGEVVKCLTDLIDYFQQPGEDEGNVNVAVVMDNSLPGRLQY